MKKLIAIMVMMLPMLAWGQTSVDIKQLHLEELSNTNEEVIVKRKDSIQPIDVCFRTNENGWTNKQNPNRDFTVWEIKGKTAKELYESAHSFLARKFSAPYGKMDGTPYSTITINGMTSEDDGIIVNGSYFCDTEFNMTFEFKDNKIRFNYPVLGRLYAHVNSYRTMQLEPRTIQDIQRDKHSYSMRFESYIRKLMLDLISHLENAAENDW